MKVSVSYLKSLYSKEKTIKLLEDTSCDYIHVDLMDGGFAGQKNFNIPEVLELLKDNKKSLDIHLMTFDPILYINDLKVLKPEYITFHLEATKDIIKTIAAIKNNGIKVGLSIKPSTDILELMPYLSMVDLVLLMSVEPGLGGQKFLPLTISRLKELIKIRSANNLNFLISVDGGINNETIKNVEKSDIVISGSYVCMKPNFDEQIKELRN